MVICAGGRRIAARLCGSDGEFLFSRSDWRLQVRNAHAVGTDSIAAKRPAQWWCAHLLWSDYANRLGWPRCCIRTVTQSARAEAGTCSSARRGLRTVWNDPEFQKIREKLAQDEPTNAGCACRVSPRRSEVDAGRNSVRSKARPVLNWQRCAKEIVSANRKREVKDFSASADNLDCVLGLFVDSAQQQLYAVSTNGFLDEAQKQRRNAVVRYDLKTGLLVSRYDAPDANQLNDLTIATDGTIYATDSAGGTLFRKTPAEKTLTPFGAKGALQGQTASPSARTVSFTLRSRPALPQSICRPDRPRACRNQTQLWPPDAMGFTGTGATWLESRTWQIQDASFALRSPIREHGFQESRCCNRIIILNSPSLRRRDRGRRVVRHRKLVRRSLSG
jgi:hypothetical protein